MVENWFLAIPFLIILFLISWVDLRERRIPNQLVLLVVVLGIISLFFGQPLFPALLGGIVYFSLLFLIHLISPEGMGFGDVKLAAALGFFLGWQRALLAFLLSFAGGAIIGIILIALKIKGRRDPIPFAPFLAGGAIVSFFWGERIIDWYLNFLQYGF
ncbi:MAG: leader peptidase (prepilin peptidase) / N-methyltransferase [Candidatus Atribacteria bacterium]|nr:leader peptidase (prepilin peptidase) / N-methyltransferase [Candidatus Atribacteria bacterium]